MSLSLQELLDTGISLEDILFNREPVQVDVNVDTQNLEQAITNDRANVLDTLRDMKEILVTSNNANKELLIKALSLMIKQSKLPDTKVPAVKEVTELKVIRDGNTNLMSGIKLIRD